MMIAIILMTTKNHEIPVLNIFLGKYLERHISAHVETVISLTESQQMGEGARPCGGWGAAGEGGGACEKHAGTAFLNA